MLPAHLEPRDLADNVQLPWSTSNDDLIELFTTIGKVGRAEIQYEPNGRSRGTGVVEFDSAENAETAICKLPLIRLTENSSDVYEEHPADFPL